MSELLKTTSWFNYVGTLLVLLAFIVTAWKITGDKFLEIRQAREVDLKDLAGGSILSQNLYKDDPAESDPTVQSSLTSEDADAPDMPDNEAESRT